MDAKIKAKWLEALRSGKYEQGRGLLRSEENKFCCLGVLCDVVDSTKWTEGGSLGYYHEPDGEINSSADTFTYPTNIVLNLAGLMPSQIDGCGSESLKVVYEGKPDIDLITLNDRIGLTFKQIADLIEEQL